MQIWQICQVWQVLQIWGVKARLFYTYIICFFVHKMAYLIMCTLASTRVLTYLPDSPTFAKPFCADSPDLPTFAKPFWADSPELLTFAKPFWAELPNLRSTFSPLLVRVHASGHCLAYSYLKMFFFSSEGKSDIF